MSLRNVEAGVNLLLIDDEADSAVPGYEFLSSPSGTRPDVQGSPSTEERA
jgi:hypothetical protein